MLSRCNTTHGICFRLQKASRERVSASARGPIAQGLATAVETSMQDQRRLLVHLANCSLGNATTMQALGMVQMLIKRKLRTVCSRVFWMWEMTGHSCKSRRRVEARISAKYSRWLLGAGFVGLSSTAVCKRALQKTARNIASLRKYRILLRTLRILHGRLSEARTLALKSCRRTRQVRRAAWANWVECCEIRQRHTRNGEKIMLRWGRALVGNAFQLWLCSRDEAQHACRRQSCASRLAEQRSRGFLCRALEEWLLYMQKKNALAREALANLRVQNRAEARAAHLRKRLCRFALHAWQDSARSVCLSRLSLTRFRLRSCRRQLSEMFSFWVIWQSQMKRMKIAIASFHVGAAKRSIGKIYIAWVDCTEGAQAARKRGDCTQERLEQFVLRTEVRFKRFVFTSFEVILAQQHAQSKLKSRIRTKRQLCTFGFAFKIWRVQHRYKKLLVFRSRQIANRHRILVLRAAWDWAAAVSHEAWRRTSVARAQVRCQRALVSRVFDALASYVSVNNVAIHHRSKATSWCSSRILSKSVFAWSSVVKTTQRVMRLKTRLCKSTSRSVFLMWYNILLESRQSRCKARVIRQRLKQARSVSTFYNWKQFAKSRAIQGLKSGRVVQMVRAHSLRANLYFWSNSRLQSKSESKVILQGNRSALARALSQWISIASDQKILDKHVKCRGHSCNILQRRRKCRIWSALVAGIQDERDRATCEAMQRTFAARWWYRHLAQKVFVDWECSMHTKKRFRIGMQHVIRRQVIHDAILMHNEHKTS